MTQSPVLIPNEINELCTLHAFIEFLEREKEITKFKRWKENFEAMHRTCKGMIMERWVCFKDAGALKRIKDEVAGAKVLVMQKGNNYIKGNEEEFRQRVAADDMYLLAEICQTARCQNCTKCKDACDLYELFNKYGFEKFDVKKQNKGICPYSVTLCEENLNA